MEEEEARWRKRWKTRWRTSGGNKAESGELGVLDMGVWRKSGQGGRQGGGQVEATRRSQVSSVFWIWVVEEEEGLWQSRRRRRSGEVTR